jgi:hypothetical protein
MSSAVVVGSSTLAGGALGFAGNLIRDLIGRRVERRRRDLDLMAAARHVFHELANFQTTARLYNSGTMDQFERLATESLSTQHAWDRYGDVIAREPDIGYTVIGAAYRSLGIALTAIAEDTTIPDSCIAHFEIALEELRPYIAVPERWRAEPEPSSDR